MVTVDVTEYGADVEGRTESTDEIQSAIDDCGDAGGGVVRFPSGEYLTGPLFLRSGVRVHVESGALVRALEDVESYPGVAGRWEGVEREVYASLFTGHDLTDVSITGRGTIDGGGEVWWATYRRDEQDHELGRGRPYPGELDYPRPRVINLYDCENVLVRGVTIRNSPSWTVHPVYCENVAVEGVTVENPESSVNTDGINPDSCQHVRIANCHIDVGDDCITIKSGFDEDGREVGEPCENVVVTNCTMRRGHGGVTIGSEMSGDVRNVVVSNCVFDGTDRGLRIKTRRGRGGVIENIRASTIVMRDIEYSGFTVSMHYHDGKGDPDPDPVTEGTPTVRGVHYENVTVAGADTAALVEGLPEMPVQDFTLSNVRVEGARRGFDVSNAEGVFLHDVTASAEETPAVAARSVTDLDVDRLRSPDPAAGEPVCRFADVDGALVHACAAAEGTGTFLELDDCVDVELTGNRLGRAETAVSE
ncbi:MAG: glycoside hydrolase family 28 protein [Halobacteriaceae archaeon]